MKRALLAFGLSLILVTLKAQIEGDFTFGEISTKDLEMSVYPKDSSANAVVLNEFGRAFIGLDGDNRFKVFFYYHKRVKIFNKSGFDVANIVEHLSKSKSSNNIEIKEQISNIKASTYYLSSGNRQVANFDKAQVFTETHPKYDLVKFTLPNISEGVIIEYSYTTESPYLWNFHQWNFQESIPKVRSEFISKIPATHVYNVALRGFLKLTKTESSLINRCLTFGSGAAQCAETRFVMENIPAFVEEDYMTSKHNFVSGIQFELKEYHGIDDGVRTKYTKEWKDVDNELRSHEDFGQEIRRGRYNFWEEKLSALYMNEADTLKRAKKVYNFIRNWYTWNGSQKFWCEDGIKKAFERRSGDVSEINLSLISALRYANIDAQPLILATRDWHVPTELYPVLSEFNYVVAVCKINNKTYYLDATERLLPFGMLPLRCLNGKGRLISTDFKSEWMEIPNKDRKRVVTMMNLKLEKEGNFKGKVSNTYFGYEGFVKRKEIGGFNSIEEYVNKIDEKNDRLKISSFKIDNIEATDTTLFEVLEVEIKGGDELNTEKFTLDPFLGNRLTTNPFKAKERLYPVDFGMPFEYQTVVQLEVPDDLKVTSMPERIALLLPANGGKYVYNVQQMGNKIMLNQVLTINKPIYSSEEYYYLKELYSKLIQAQNVDLIFEREASSQK